MTKKQKRDFAKKLAQRFAVIFIVSVLVLTAAGLLGFSHNYIISDDGLQFHVIVIIAGIALAIAFLSIVIVRVHKKKTKTNRYDKLFKQYKIYRKR
ncbi:MAG: hypothetical protein FWD28_05350 [Treponema sp.]|nr:hypothetical protein [Treponema sp.]